MILLTLLAISCISSSAADALWRDFSLLLSSLAMLSRIVGGMKKHNEPVPESSVIATITDVFNQVRG